MIDDQAHLIDLGIDLAKNGDWASITSEMIDALIADRADLINALESDHKEKPF